MRNVVWSCDWLIIQISSLIWFLVVCKDISDCYVEGNIKSNVSFYLCKWNFIDTVKIIDSIWRANILSKCSWGERKKKSNSYFYSNGT